MDVTERRMLIQRGNELFNNKDYKNALKIFLAVNDRDGIARMASILEYEKKDRVAALKLYKKAGFHNNVEKLAYEMAQAVRLLIKEDKEIEAFEKGENYNSGYKISGQAPTMLPEEALLRAKVKLGLIDDKEFLANRANEPIPWKPTVISKYDMDKFKK